MGYTLAKDFQPPEPQPAYDERGVYRLAWDGIGNLVALYKDGAEAAMYEYSPYGDGARERGDGRSASQMARRAEEAGALRAATKQLLRSRGPYADHNPLRYGSKLADSLTGLIDFGKRHYSPALGRFVTRDPLQEQGGLNLYRYAGNDPVNAIDVLGLSLVGPADLNSTQTVTSGDYSSAPGASNDDLVTIGPVYGLPTFTVEGDSPTPFVDFTPGLLDEFTSDARNIVNVGENWRSRSLDEMMSIFEARYQSQLDRKEVALNAQRQQYSVEKARREAGTRLEGSSHVVTFGIGASGTLGGRAAGQGGFVHSEANLTVSIDLKNVLEDFLNSIVLSVGQQAAFLGEGAGVAAQLGPQAVLGYSQSLPNTMLQNLANGSDNLGDWSTTYHVEGGRAWFSGYGASMDIDRNGSVSGSYSFGPDWGFAAYVAGGSAVNSNHSMSLGEGAMAIQATSHLMREMTSMIWGDLLGIDD